jgi:hypothetical protein
MAPPLLEDKRIAGIATRDELHPVPATSLPWVHRHLSSERRKIVPPLARFDPAITQ